MSNLKLIWKRKVAFFLFVFLTIL